MKEVTFILLSFMTLSCYAQASVSTITPQFKGSGGLSLDTEGNLYIGDFGDFLGAGDGDGLPNNVWKLDTDLNLTVYSGDFVGASGNAFDSNGTLYQSDISDGAVYRIINNSRELFTSTGINQPVGLVFDSNGDLFVCNCGNNTIRRVTPGGVSTQFVAGSPLSCPNGITIDEDDNLYVSNFSGGEIIKITPSGTMTVLNTTQTGTTSGPSNGHLDYHAATCSLFIASHGANKIYYLNIDDPSNMQVLAGSGVRGNTDGDALTATFSRPNGVAVTQTGDSIYINSAIPTTNTPNRPLNPQVIRLIKGVQGTLSVETVTTPYYNLNVYPNPVQNDLKIEAQLTSNQSSLNLKVYSIIGTTVAEISSIQTRDKELRLSVDMSKMASGIYFYTLSSDTSKQLLNGRIIKN